MTDDIIKSGDRTQLSLIEGSQLSAVTFVQDYLQLAFDGPRLTVYTWPTVTNKRGQYSLRDSGYRDQLCGQISKVVQSAFAISDDHLKMEFDDGSTIVISLKANDYRGPEAVMLQDDATKTFAVW